DLTRRCLVADGGLPQSSSDGFLRSRYFSPSTRTLGGYVDDRLVTSAAVRSTPTGDVAVGQVDPEVRAMGCGRYLMDWSLRSGGVISVHTESNSPSAEQLYARYALQRTFAEQILTCSLVDDLPEADIPRGITIQPWQPEAAADFFDSYRQSFADRPG